MDPIYDDNLRLNELEYRDRRSHLRSQPISFTVVIGNTCNIRCGHCYQSKNGDNLLKSPSIGRELRQEFAQFYPYLSTLLLMGGEVFAIDGFEAMLEDVAAATKRPIVSVATNGTLINDAWAEKIVRMPFSHVEVSIDGGTAETYNRLRRGADLDEVLANIGRIQDWKKKLGSELPYLGSFFVVMRSNFREIPLYLRHLRNLEINSVTLETVRASRDNLARDPELMAREEIAHPAEVRELHGLLKATLQTERAWFRGIRFSGVTALFERHGLDAGFLEENAFGLYPDSDQLVPLDGSSGFELCPNPWTTVFITENGDVRICFLSDPIGNLYETPLAALWNSPPAMTQRRRMTQGRYADANCSVSHCGWREGKAGTESSVARFDAEIRKLTATSVGPLYPVNSANEAQGIAAVRRMLQASNQKVAELEAICGAGIEGEVSRLKKDYDGLLDGGQRQIDNLEGEVSRLKKDYDGLLDGGQRQIDHLEAKCSKAIDEFRKVEMEFAEYRRSPLVRLAHMLSTL